MIPPEISKETCLTNSDEYPLQLHSSSLTDLPKLNSFPKATGQTRKEANDTTRNLKRN